MTTQLNKTVRLTFDDMCNPTFEKLHLVLPNLKAVAKMLGVGHSRAKEYAAYHELPRHDAGWHAMYVLNWWVHYKSDPDQWDGPNREDFIRLLNVCGDGVADDPVLLPVFIEAAEDLMHWQWFETGLEQWQKERWHKPDTTETH